jgi:hypothetical protein
MFKIHQILQDDCLKHKEELYFLAQLQISSGLQVIILEQIQIWNS